MFFSAYGGVFGPLERDQSRRDGSHNATRLYMKAMQEILNPDIINFYSLLVFCGQRFIQLNEQATKPSFFSLSG